MATTDIRPTITLACTVCKHRNYTTRKNKRNDPDLGLDYSRVVHGEQEFVHHRPIRAGDRLLATGKVASAAAKGPHELLTLETEITSEDGEPVCTVRATLLSRGTAPPREGRA